MSTKCPVTTLYEATGLIYPRTTLFYFCLSGLAEAGMAVYLLAYIQYAAVFGGSKIFSYPTLLKAKTSFSMFVLALILLAFGDGGSDFCYSLFGGASNVTFFTFVLRLIMLISSTALLYVNRDYLAASGIIKYEYDLLIVFSVMSLILLGCSDDFLVVYLTIELQSLAFYVLATFQRNSEFSAEAGLKYFVLGALSSGLLLFGFNITYVTFGATSFEVLAKLLSASLDTLSFWGLLFATTAFFFKLGVAPFHMWLCDVYEGCLTSVTAFFAAVPKVMLFGLMLKLSTVVFIQFENYNSLLLMMTGLLSVCFASVAALYQKRVKRLLAYSTISHSGFILLGICCASVDSVKSCVIYIAIYALTSLSTFSVIMYAGIENAIPKYLINWTAIARRNFTLALSFALFLFSVAGIPPLAGFYSKLCILLSLLGKGHCFLAVVVIVFSSIACFYYIRLVKIFFFTVGGNNNFWSGFGTRNLELFIGSGLSITWLFLTRPLVLNTMATLAALTIM